MNENYIKNAFFLCRAIGAVVKGEKCEIEKCETLEDLDNRLKFLKIHNMITLFDFVIDKDEFICFSGVDNYKKVCKIVNQAIFKQLKQNLMSEQLRDSLGKKGIKHIILKGTELQKYYPQDVVRISQDIDIYVQADDVNSAGQVLLDNGFSSDKIYDNKEFSYKREPRYYVELHTNMEGFSEKQKKLLLSLVDNAEGNSSGRCVLSDNACYIYTLFHLYKHFVQSGAGVRMFLDVYIIRKNTTLDYDYIAPILKELGIDGFESAVITINKCLFDGEEVPEKLKCVIEFICESGTFGKASGFKYMSNINSDITYKKPFQHIKESYGIGFKAMKNRYSVLEKFPFLYPLSFIHRFFHGILFKRDVLKKLQEEKNISKEFNNKYLKIFKAMNISGNMDEDV